MSFWHWTGGQDGRSSSLHLWCADQGLPEAQKAEASLELPEHLCQSTGSLWSPFQSGQDVTQNCLDILPHPELDWAW